MPALLDAAVARWRVATPTPVSCWWVTYVVKRSHVGQVAIVPTVSLPQERGSAGAAAGGQVDPLPLAQTDVEVSLADEEMPGFPRKPALRIPPRRHADRFPDSSLRPQGRRRAQDSRRDRILIFDVGVRNALLGNHRPRLPGLSWPLVRAVVDASGPLFEARARCRLACFLVPNGVGCGGGPGHRTGRRLQSSARQRRTSF